MSYAVSRHPDRFHLQNSQINGVCVPQRRYGRGTGRGVTAHQNFLLFVRQDGTYIPVIAALANDYTGLVARDFPVFSDAGFTITLRYEVSRFSRPR